MVVIDASVANKLFLPHEEGHKEAEEIIYRHILKEEEIVVPDLLFYEVANTLTTKSRIPLSVVHESLKKLYALRLQINHFSSFQMEKATNIAKTYHVSVYDASYAVLAAEKKCNYFTADSKFIKGVNLSFIKHLEEYDEVVF